MNEQTNVNIDQDKIEAKYSDQALINHNPFGFSLDFAQLMPQFKMIKVLSRIAMSPQHAKAFAEALSENIKNYEKKFGEIELSKKMLDEADSRKIGFKIN